MSEDRRITMRLTRIENTLEEIKRNITAPMPPDRKITVREAAEIMHCSDQRVRDAIHDGSLKAERNGRRFFLSLYDVRLTPSVLTTISPRYPIPSPVFS